MRMDLGRDKVKAYLDYLAATSRPELSELLAKPKRFDAIWLHMNKLAADRDLVRGILAFVHLSICPFEHLSI